MPRVALVTYRPGPGAPVDRDLPVLLEALRAAGAEASAQVWDDPEADWAGFDLAVIRSTWDYSWRSEEFLAWVAKCGRLTRLANPAGVVRWNADKRYLGELAAAGVAVVPTRYCAPGEGVELPAEGEFVIKPTSGAGSRFAARYSAGDGADGSDGSDGAAEPDGHDTAVRHIQRLHAEGLTAMIQPYVSGIDVTGERALQFFGGRLLHASRKGAVLTPGTPFDVRKTAHPDLAVWQPTPAELAVAERALAAVPGGGELLYARVDLVDGPDGLPCVMELELVEPNMFLWLHPESLGAVVEGVLERAAG